MSRETVACTASMPSARSASASSACVERWRSRRAGRIAPCRSSFVVTPQHLPQDRSMREVGLLLRDRERRREPERGVAGGADEQVVLERGVGDRPGRAAELDREQQPGAAHARRAAPRSARRSRARARAGRRRSSRRRRTPPRSETGLPPKVEAWSPGTKPVGAPSETSSAPIGRPFARPFASVTASGRTPARCQAKNSPVRPTPVCTSSKTRSASCSSASARASLERLRRERPDAALALHRLEEDRGGLRPDAPRRASPASRSARPGRAARTAPASPAGR